MYNKSGRPDLPLMLTALACCCTGLLLAASLGYIGAAQELTSGSTDRLFVTHAVSMLAGTAICAVLTFFGPQRLTAHAYMLLAAGEVLTLLTLTPLGYSPDGSDDRAWLDLGYVTVQPSEILKVCFILSFAAHISRYGGRISRLRDLLLLLLHAAVPTATVWVQGDQGTGVIFTAVAAAMLIAGGLEVRYLIGALLILPAVGAAVWTALLAEHQKQRILTILDPTLDPLGAGYQQLASRSAIEGGGIFGSGLFSRERELVYVSQAENDFIFSYAAQVGGLVLCALIIVLEFAFVLRLLVLCGRAQDEGRLVLAGAAALFFTHTFVNIAMVLGFMPVIGVPLPFISAGGTATVSMLALTGAAQGAKNIKTEEYLCRSTS
ncbi:MAG: FtsW/RodA/SpoVE family cell cycle protein [Ruminococcus sp.]|nr:FtsW/RodA/SpoVE family cell cycle protein [Ruminococcus sp.]